jgi:uncharacterized protein
LSPVVVSLTLMAVWPERYGEPGHLVMSSARLWGTLCIELLLMATIGRWLWRRGWRPHRTATLAFAPRDVGRGLGIWAAGMIAAWASVLVWYRLAPAFTASASSTQILGQPSIMVVVAVSVVNAVFEEFLWLGLGIAALRRYGVGVAALVSVGLRTLVHAYQGPLAVITILPLGVVFTWYYVRSGRLWPVVVAHTVQDLLVLGALALRASGRGAA